MQLKRLVVTRKLQITAFIKNSFSLQGQKYLGLDVNDGNFLFIERSLNAGFSYDGKQNSASPNL